MKLSKKIFGLSLVACAATPVIASTSCANNDIAANVKLDDKANTLNANTSQSLNINEQHAKIKSVEQVITKTSVEKVKRWMHRDHTTWGEVTNDLRFADTHMSLDGLLKSQEEIENQWNFKSKCTNDFNKTLHYKYDFSTKRAAKDYKKSLFWTNAVTVEIPAKTTVRLSIDKLNYYLNAKMKAGCVYYQNAAVYGLLVSPFYENLNEHPVKGFGDYNQLSWEATIGKRNNATEFYQDDFFQHNDNWGHEGGLFFLHKDRGAIGWTGDTLTPNKKYKVDEDDDFDPRLIANRGCIIPNNDDKPLIKTLYFDTWILASPHNGRTTAGMDNYPIKLDNSWLSFDINLRETPKKTTFANATWEDICKWANEGIDSLHKHFAEEVQNNNGSLVGLEREIILNDHAHKVKVIAENHDEIAGQPGKKAALTFELLTLLSDKNGNAMQSIWGHGDNKNYTNSVLRKNLTGKGHPTKKGVWKKNVLSMLEEQNLDLYANLKEVTKQVAISKKHKPTDYNDFKPTFYNDKLFPFTFTELAQSGVEEAITEGSAYTYWTNHKSSDARIKKDANGVAYYYWLSSPYVSRTTIGGVRSINTNYAWAVSAGGELGDYTNVSRSQPVTFGFCI